MEDHFSWLRIERARDMLAVVIPETAFPAARAVSWAIHGGGFIAPRIIVNHSTKGRWIENIDAYVAEFLADRRFPAESIVMLTTVSAEFQGSAEVRDEKSGLAVRAYATVGLGNALAAGDPATEPVIGTINLIVAIAATCSDEALLESLAIATEAKARFLSEHAVRSTVSDALATGTGTDCAAILSLGIGKNIRYAGKHTKVGELVACAVMEAMADSIRHRHAIASYRVLA